MSETNREETPNALAPTAPMGSDEELLVEDLEERITQGGIQCASSSTTCDCTCSCCWYAF